MIVFPLGSIATFSARPPSILIERILGCVLMSAFTMRLLTVVIYASGAVSNVIHRIKVHRIDAEPSPAQMIQFFTFRNRAFQQFIYYAMWKQGRSIAPYAPIAQGPFFASCAAKPQPTAGMRFEEDLIHNPLRQIVDHQEVI